MTFFGRPSPTVAMSEDHEAHLNRIKDAFRKDVDAKYRKGQAEHGGKLWLKQGMLDHAIEEAIDLYVYLATLREQRETDLRCRAERGDPDDMC